MRCWRATGAAACAHCWRDWRDGRIKLATIATLLRHRRAWPELYAEGDYQPLPALGARADELCAYARTRLPQILIVAVARGSQRREAAPFDEATLLVLPEALRRREWHELLSGRTLRVENGHLRPADVFADLPAAVLTTDAVAAADAPAGH